MKRLRRLCGTALSVAVLAVCLCAFARAETFFLAPDIGIFVDGESVTTEQPPVLVNDRTLVPIRAVAEAAGVTVGWDGETRRVSLGLDVLTVTLTLDSDRMTVYNAVIDDLKTVTLDATPRLYESRTYVNLRAVIEALGGSVDWDGDERRIDVTSPEKLRADRAAAAASTASGETDDDPVTDKTDPEDAKPDTEDSGKDDKNDKDDRDGKGGKTDKDDGIETPPERDCDDEKKDDGEPEDEAVVITYMGFRKMTNDTIDEHAPHGLYGTVTANHPLLSVRCRIAGTDMDYTETFDETDEVTSYNVFSYFDPIICFSDAGRGKQTFELYADAGDGEQLLFRYVYRVRTGEDETPQDEADAPAVQTETCLPLEGTVAVTSPYGFRDYNKWEFHKGIDIIAFSTKVMAAADGEVVDCATGRNSGIGNYVALRHEDGWVSLYYHLESYCVGIGDEVSRGQQIGVMGNSGGNYGTHLHFMTCDGWYGSLWETQNNHHTAPHVYVPELLNILYYTPSFEKETEDRVILRDFSMPSVLYAGEPYSISDGVAYIASENGIVSLRFVVTNEDGEAEIDETQEEPTFRGSDDYRYYGIGVELDRLCRFDLLTPGEKTAALIAVTENGRVRTLYERRFVVKEKPAAQEDGEDGEDEEDAPKGGATGDGGKRDGEVKLSDEDKGSEDEKNDPKPAQTEAGEDSGTDTQEP